MSAANSILLSPARRRLLRFCRILLPNAQLGHGAMGGIGVIMLCETWPSGLNKIAYPIPDHLDRESRRLYSVQAGTKTSLSTDANLAPLVRLGSRMGTDALRYKTLLRNEKAYLAWASIFAGPSGGPHGACSRLKETRNSQTIVRRSYE